jgi:hypothetical protein
MHVFHRIVFAGFFLFFLQTAMAQPVTGVWRGKIRGVNTELKLVKTGDDLVGVVYYYSGKNRYKRYSVKGNFDDNTNAVIWWDELPLDGNGQPKTMLLGPDPEAQMTVADFNCPGSEEMYLDGNSSTRDNASGKTGEVHLVKMDKPLFPDEWDELIDNYFVGGNDPELIARVSEHQLPRVPEEKPSPEILTIEPPQPVAEKPAAPALVKNSNLDKFSSRKKVLQTVIPITAKTIELNFYDNAEIDGDSIALFLNGRQIFEHIRLTDQPYKVVLQASELGADNELVMVAENLGSIPPNTSFMSAKVGDKSYEARLYANENSSALIRIVQPKPGTE